MVIIFSLRTPGIVEGIVGLVGGPVNDAETNTIESIGNKLYNDFGPPPWKKSGGKTILEKSCQGVSDEGKNRSGFE
jgi:hypothetical protein